MVQIDIVYEGTLHSIAKHAPSGTTIVTDAPVDNMGKGESFSPTDLMATALGTCMATTMGMVAKKRGYAIENTQMRVGKAMTQTPPRRIERLEVRIEMPAGTAGLDAEARASLEEAAHTCPVRISLLPAIEVPVEFVWP